MANTIAGGVQLINTLTQKNNGEFPIVMAESVSLNDGTTVEDKFKTIVNYSHPNTPGYKHVPAGGSDGQILRWKADGEAQWGDDNTGEKYEVFKPATSTTSAVDGLVPAPSINETNRFLKSDGTWGIPTDTTYEEVTEIKSGLMSSSDKVKLDAIEEEANKYVHPTGSGSKHIPSGGSSGKILRWKADGEAQWGDDNNTVYTEATESKSGLMSYTDKIKLNTVAESANNYSHPTGSGYNHIPSGGSVGQILRFKSDGEAEWGDDSNTTYSEATESTSGLMSSSDKKKLNTIAENANNYTHPTGSGYKHIPSGGTSGQILRWDSDGTATWGEDKDTTYKEATSTTSGLFSSTDKVKLDNIAERANNYVHPTTSGNKHIPSGGTTGQILRWSSDGTAVWGDETETSYSIFKGATSSTSGTDGLVPAPSAGNQEKYLRADGTWQTPPDNDTTYSVATQSANGLLSSTDKKKLDTIAENANNYSHPTGSGYNHIPSGGASGQILRWSSNGTATWGNDEDTTYEVATQTTSGLLSSTDKKKLDSIEENANKYTHPSGTGYNHIPSGGSAGQVLKWSADGTAGWAKDEDTTYSEATSTTSGLLSASDKKKLDTVASNANNYVHPTTSGNKHIPSGGASGKILRWKADGEAQWGDDNNTTYSEASETSSGLMSSSDKKKLDGISENANNYVHPTTSGNKHIPSGGSSGQILRWNSDGTAVWGDETETSYSTFRGATASSSGTDGLVPAPTAGNQAKYLRADGTWQTPPDTDTTYEAATTTVAGLFSPADKKKLDGIEDNANNYSHPTGSGSNHIPSGGSAGQVLKWSADGTAQWGTDENTTYSEATSTTAGLLSALDKKKLDTVAENANNYSHPITSGNKHIPSGGSAGQILRWSSDGTATWGDDEDTTYSEATQTTSGLLSSTDKKKIDNIAEGANNYVHPTTSGNKHVPSGGSSGQILIWSSDGTATWGSDKNTTYTLSGSASSSNGNSKITLTSSDSSTNSVTVKGTGGSTVTTDASGNMSINSITVVSSSTAPIDQTVGSIWIKTETA